MRIRRLIVIFGTLGLACDRGSDSSVPSSGSSPASSPRVESDEEKLAKSTRAYARVKDEIERIQRMVMGNPGDPSLRYEFGRLLVAGGLEERGLVELHSALALDGRNVKAASLLGKVLLQRGDIEAATRVLEAAEKSKGTPEYCVLEAGILLQRDPTAVERALELLRLGVRADPRHVDANYELANLAQRTGDLKTAERCLRVVIEREPGHLGGHFNLARLLRRLERNDEADLHQRIHKRLAILETLGQLADPETVNAYLGVAEILQSGGDLEGALSEFENGIERFPEAALLRVRQALALIQSGRAEEGRKAFEVALRKLPDDPIVMNQFAWYLATNGVSDDDRRRAVKLAERAVVATRREDPNVLDTLAEARAAIGDFPGADQAIAEALARKPGDPGLTKRRAEFRERAKVKQ